MKWTVVVLGPDGNEEDYRMEVEGEALPSIGDHVVVQHNDQPQKVLKVRQVIHSLHGRGDQTAIDKLTVEAEPVDRLLL
jgi:hypothetical protein